MKLAAPRIVMTVAAATAGSLALLCACTSSHGGSSSSTAAALSSGSIAASSSSASASATPTGGQSSSTSATTRATGGKSTRPRHSSSPAPKGSLSTVAPIKAKTKSPVPLKSPAQFGSGVTARVVNIAHGTETDTGPGALTGRPTVTFTLSLHNGTTRAVSVNTVQVSAVYGADKNPASPANQSSTKPFAGNVPSGKSQQGTYSFAIPTAGQKRVTVYVWYKEHEPTVAFAGDAS